MNLLTRNLLTLTLIPFFLCSSLFIPPTCASEIQPGIQPNLPKEETAHTDPELGKPEGKAEVHVNSVQGEGGGALVPGEASFSSSFSPSSGSDLGNSQVSPEVSAPEVASEEGQSNSDSSSNLAKSTATNSEESEESKLKQVAQEEERNSIKKDLQLQDKAEEQAQREGETGELGEMSPFAEGMEFANQFMFVGMAINQLVNLVNPYVSPDWEQMGGDSGKLNFNVILEEDTNSLHYWAMNGVNYMGGSYFGAYASDIKDICFAQFAFDMNEWAKDNILIYWSTTPDPIGFTFPPPTEPPAYHTSQDFADSLHRFVDEIIEDANANIKHPLFCKYSPTSPWCKPCSHDVRSCWDVVYTTYAPQCLPDSCPVCKGDSTYSGIQYTANICDVFNAYVLSPLNDIKNSFKGGTWLEVFESLLHMIKKAKKLSKSQGVPDLFKMWFSTLARFNYVYPEKHTATMIRIPRSTSFPNIYIQVARRLPNGMYQKMSFCEQQYIRLQYSFNMATMCNQEGYGTRGCEANNFKYIANSMECSQSRSSSAYEGLFTYSEYARDCPVETSPIRFMCEFQTNGNSFISPSMIYGNGKYLSYRGNIITAQDFYTLFQKGCTYKSDRTKSLSGLPVVIPPPMPLSTAWLTRACRLCLSW
eukprot:Nk52_evm12s278 gene=Nk52_evmTU12s278